jgi:hypothetical protein
MVCYALNIRSREAEGEGGKYFFLHRFFCHDTLTSISSLYSLQLLHQSSSLSLVLLIDQMATSMNANSDQQDSTVGFLLVCGDINSNDQREDIFHFLERALKQINARQAQKVNDLFNDLINDKEFQAGSDKIVDFAFVFEHVPFI